MKIETIRNLTMETKKLLQTVNPTRLVEKPIKDEIDYKSSYDYKKDATITAYDIDLRA
jgi:hypothetical protein